MREGGSLMCLMLYFGYKQSNLAVEALSTVKASYVHQGHSSGTLSFKYVLLFRTKQSWL